jgi:Fur family ferric uptake transcriptional regulator
MRALSKDAIARGIERLHEAVRAKGLKQSAVRDEIARAALGYAGHFGVEDLVAMLRARGDQNTHAATVYRTLPLLIDAGLIEMALVGRGDGQRYEAVFEREHHDHIVCTQCGEVVEFHSETLEALQREIADRYGFVLEDHIHELRGRCKNCRAARRSS